MKITDITVQARNPDRVNVSVDGKYRFSLDILQVTELGVKVGREYSEDDIASLENESQFGKLYSRALEYTMMRPHSSREIRDYLWRKTRDTKVKTRTGELRDKPGVSKEIADRVFERLAEKGYVSDEKFARYWIENRNLRKGSSTRKLVAELRAKGVDQSIIDENMQNSTRSEESELKMIIAKKRARYDDEQKLMAYLMRQGFPYDMIREAMSETES